MDALYFMIEVNEVIACRDMIIYSFNVDFGSQKSVLLFIECGR